MSDTLYVTPAQVLAAKLSIELSEEDGEVPDEALKAIANAQVVNPDDAQTENLEELSDAAARSLLEHASHADLTAQMVVVNRGRDDMTMVLVDFDSRAAEWDIQPPVGSDEPAEGQHPMFVVAIGPGGLMGVTEVNRINPDALNHAIRAAKRRLEQARKRVVARNPIDSTLVERLQDLIEATRHPLRDADAEDARTTDVEVEKDVIR
jgi:hypothetical protein